MMRHFGSIVLLVSLGAAGITVVRAGADVAALQEQDDSGAEDEPLLLLDDEPLLLLDDSSGDAQKEKAGADNSRCQVCHLNIAMEEIAVKHARKDIGCAACHGPCDAHIDDESWASGGPGTPPEIMYPREKIDPACQKCHEAHDAPAREVVKRWQERGLSMDNPQDVVCTDCHGHHRIKTELRNAWWDKHTGKPVKPPRSR
jgi:hypothetical protein